MSSAPAVDDFDDDPPISPALELFTGGFARNPGASLNMLWIAAELSFALDSVAVRP